jgi:Domain of Unknown Function (DUF928)
MPKTKFLVSAIAITYTLISVLISSCAYASKAQSPAIDHDSSIHFVPPPPPESGEPTGRVQGGGSRGQCRSDRTLMALVPVTEMAGKTYVWGLTTVGHPTFMFYVPERTQAESMEFILQDEADREVYTIRLTIAKTESGLVRISLPATIPPLVVGQKYRWLFAMDCDPQSPSTAVFVRGTIQRVALEAKLQAQLTTTKTPLERAAVYASNGIWHDALAILSDPVAAPQEASTIKAAWVDLLEQVGLADPARTPIIWRADR